MISACPIRGCGELRSHKVKKFGYKKCSQCDGVWLNHKSLDQMSKNGVALRFPLFSTIDESERAITQREIYCPTDAHKFHEHNHQGVTIDICRECSGVWLDGQRLEKARKGSREKISDNWKYFIDQLTKFLWWRPFST